tara:strand:- start:1604 stop:2014 length:411 start_codon:yes stop_codon:yes gene_type:complete
MSVGKNMMLVNSSFRGMKSYSLIPVSLDCPYVETMYDPSSGMMAVITKQKKESFHMVPKLDEEGQPMRLKKPNPQTGKTVKEVRVKVDTFSEFYITDKEDLDNFITLFAINSLDFDYKSFHVDVDKVKKQSIITPA